MSPPAVSAGILAGAREQYALGNNVTGWLHDEVGSGRTEEIVEIAYDLQAGSYTAYRRDHAHAVELLAEESAAFLDEVLRTSDQLLDAGCGEATTLCEIGRKLVTPCRILGLDLSWSRIRWARQNAVAYGLPAVQAHDLVVGTMAALPLAARSVDVAITHHALEPNRGSEVTLLRELIRVARRKVMLFEPCYERVDAAIRARMDLHGYVTALEQSATAAGGHVCRVVKLEHSGNPLNPTFLIEIDVDDDGDGNVDRHGRRAEWCCPETFEPVVDAGDCWYSERVGLAYPIVGGIPVLRAEKAVIATQLAPIGSRAA
jgi:uncharacterized protein YbaR (Trm112 family)